MRAPGSGPESDGQMQKSSESAAAKVTDAKPELAGAPALSMSARSKKKTAVAIRINAASHVESRARVMVMPAPEKHMALRSPDGKQKEVQS